MGGQAEQIERISQRSENFNRSAFMVGSKRAVAQPQKRPRPDGGELARQEKRETNRHPRIQS